MTAARVLTVAAVACTLLAVVAMVLVEGATGARIGFGPSFAAVFAAVWWAGNRKAATT